MGGPFETALGPFGVIIKDSVKLTAEATSRFMFKIGYTRAPPVNMPGLGWVIQDMGSAKIGFDFDFEAKIKFECGAITKVGNALKRYPATRIGNINIPSGQTIYDAIWPKFIDEICNQPRELSYKISFAFEGSKVDRTNTYIEGSAGGIAGRVSMDELPLCPAGGLIGDRCSKNSDCYEDDAEMQHGYTHGQGKASHAPYPGGYCKNDDTFKTSILCLGRCIRLREVGESCAAGELNTFNFAHTAEHEACRSGECRCGKCASPGSGRSGNGSPCSSNAGCETTSYCEKKTWQVGCSGICKAKIADVQPCYKSNGITCDDSACVANSHICGRCGGRKSQPQWASCSTDADCTCYDRSTHHGRMLDDLYSS